MASASVQKLSVELKGNTTLWDVLAGLAGELHDVAGDPAGTNRIADEIEAARMDATAPKAAPAGAVEVDVNGEPIDGEDDDEDDDDGDDEANQEGDETVAVKSQKKAQKTAAKKAARK